MLNSYKRKSTLKAHTCLNYFDQNEHAILFFNHMTYLKPESIVIAENVVEEF